MITTFLRWDGFIPKLGTSFWIGRLSASDIDYHGYPVTWYQQSIDPNSTPLAGIKLSIATGAAPGNISDSYYTGALDGTVAQISKAQAEYLVRLHLASDVGSPIILLTANAINAAVQAAGHVVVNIEQHFDQDTQVYVSTPSIILEKHSPSYAWLPITIPGDAKTMLLDFKFSNLSSSDWLSIGINDTLLFALEAQFAGDGQQNTTNPLDVSSWAGQNVELFLGLNNVDDENAGGTITVDNIRFETVPEPSTWAMLGAGGAVLLGFYRSGRNRD